MSKRWVGRETDAGANRWPWPHAGVIAVSPGYLPCYGPWGMSRLVEPPSMQRYAAENLQFIRDTMARAGGFTAVPGWGGVLMGLSALATPLVAGQPGDPGWLGIWLAEAALGVAIGLVAVARKARRVGVPLSGAAARRFALALLPALGAGAILTGVLVRQGSTALLPGCWLLLYGVAVTSGGAFSVRPVPVMGLAFMALGVVTFLAPGAWGNMFMAAGFGGLHVIFGLIIARRFGG